MKDDIELDDRILGTALARAIESQSARETPFESSRAAAVVGRPSRSFSRLLLAAAAVIVLGLAVTAALGIRQLGENAPAATQPAASSAALPTTAPLPSASAVALLPVPVLVYFARDGLPPVATTVLGHGGGPASATIDGRILERIGALTDARANDAPPNSFNALAFRPQVSKSRIVTGVRTQGDTATLDLTFDPPLAPRSASDVNAIVQQLVYTATEEPGIARVQLTMNDGRPMVLGGFPVDTTALSRADVSGYTSSGLTGTFQFDGASAPSQLTTSYSVDVVAPALARFTIAVAFTGSVPARTAPQFTVSAYDQTHMPGANAELEILVPNGADATTAAAQVDRPPLRSIAIGSPVRFPAKVYRLGLDHLWPWRAVVLFDPTRIVIDVGGAPSAISGDQNEAVYAPAPNTEIGHAFTLSGAARAHDTTINFRVRDGRQNVVLDGVTKASIGASSVWGGYDSTVSLPTSVSGNVTLEVFEVSPKDGTELSKVTIPLRVR